jgi:hypothetical protein
MRITRDGKAYDSGDAIVTGLGQIWDEVVELTYSTGQEHQVNHTIGSNVASSWSRGKITHDGTITLMMNQISAIEKAAGGSLLSIKPFDLNVSFFDEFNALINDTITCKFMSQGRTINTEMGLSQQYTLFVLSIDYNNAG